MEFWVYDETNGDTCAGAKIGASMYGFSSDLFEGCKYNAYLAKNADKVFQIRSANMSCILFSVSAVEAKLNEYVSMLAYSYEGDSIWKRVKEQHSRKPLSEKWNIIANDVGGEIWDHTQEPFRSYNLVKSLRNELVHYKGHLLRQDQAPNIKIKEIMDTLGVKSEASFIEDDCSSWVNDLINNQDLASLVVEYVTPVFENMNTYLLHVPKNEKS
jgi:hypothetical protein